ncbi:MAG: tRNA (adenosine(37)-N6)-threonylcarbamoyltransferase complex dimerization subunit type 1 TsaB [Treponema sp.]|nr:tRNA (adenosine(37)-N6)-threonylcarbamoyltransferase complex dimerization subunit type 1 TsaB [Treponema sp.]
MKALAIDCACSRLTVAAKNEDKTCTAIYDIGMRQSETLVPAIDFVLEKCSLAKNELDYTTLTIGPGSFTGLRLGISALKAIECAAGTPVYGISSLETYAFPYASLGLPVLSCIDANKDRFFAGVYSNGKSIIEDGDYDIPFLAEKLKDTPKVILAGFEKDTEKLKDLLSKALPKIELIQFPVSNITTDSLFELAEMKLNSKAPSLQEYDGPVYLRASEAEIKLNQ